MAPKGSVAAVRAPASRQTVLVIDDERVIRDLLQLHLRNAGYDVVLAADAVEGGKRLLEGGVHLVVIDAQLPYLSGIEFASTLIADTTLPSLPILMITGDDHLAARAERLGVPCLVKPFSAECFIGLVESSLGTAPAGVAAEQPRLRRRA